MKLDSFWAVYVDAGLIPAFSALRNKRGDEVSSGFMWYLQFTYSPENDHISKVPEEQRTKLLDEYCGVKPKDKESALFKEAEKFFKDYWLSEEAQLLKSLQGQVLAASKVVREFVPYSPEDVEKLVVAAKSFKDFKKLIEETRADFKATNDKKDKGYGGKEIGGRDDGSLFR